MEFLSLLLIEAGDGREEVDEGDPAEAGIEADNRIMNFRSFARQSFKMQEYELEN